MARAIADNAELFEAVKGCVPAIVTLTFVLVAGLPFHLRSSIPPRMAESELAPIQDDASLIKEYSRNHAKHQ